jgi:hypothetical protein
MNENVFQQIEAKHQRGELTYGEMMDCMSLYTRSCMDRDIKTTEEINEVDESGIRFYLSSWGYLSMDIPPDITQDHWATVGIDFLSNGYCLVE